MFKVYNIVLVLTFHNVSLEFNYLFSKHIIFNEKDYLILFEFCIISYHFNNKYYYLILHLKM